MKKLMILSFLTLSLINQNLHSSWSRFAGTFVAINLCLHSQKKLPTSESNFDKGIEDIKKVYMSKIEQNTLERHRKAETTPCADPRIIKLFNEIKQDMGIKETINLMIALPGHKSIINEGTAACYATYDFTNLRPEIILTNPSTPDEYWLAFIIRHELEHHRQQYKYPGSYHGTGSERCELFADIEGLKVCRTTDNEKCWTQIMKHRQQNSNSINIDANGYIIPTFIKQVPDHIKEKYRNA